MNFKEYQVYKDQMNRFKEYL